MLFILLLYVFRYLYWSDSKSVHRASLNSVQLNSTLDSCANSISSSISLINNTQLETFTIEPNEAIYYVGYDSCFENSSVSRTNRSILGTSLNIQSTRVSTGISTPVVSIDSFDRTLFSATESLLISVDTSQVVNCPIYPTISFDTLGSPVLTLRIYRSVKQPLPGREMYRVKGFAGRKFPHFATHLIGDIFLPC